MKHIIKYLKDDTYLALALAFILFISALYLDKLIEFIIYMLYFVIFLEIVRAILNYIREQRVVLALLVDAFIILSLRELIVNVVKINNEKIDSIDALLASNLNYNILIISIVIIFLLGVRYLAVKTSQKYLLDKNGKKELKDTKESDK